MQRLIHTARASYVRTDPTGKTVTNLITRWGVSGSVHGIYHCGSLSGETLAEGSTHRSWFSCEMASVCPLPFMVALVHPANLSLRKRAGSLGSVQYLYSFHSLLISVLWLLCVPLIAIWNLWSAFHVIPKGQCSPYLTLTKGGESSCGICAKTVDYYFSFQQVRWQ